LAEATSAAATDDARRAAVAEVPPTLRWREVPSSAYTSSETTSVYRPACGGRPAMPAYAIPSGTTSPQRVSPAIASNVSHERS
jgi:hypothetical protein